MDKTLSMDAKADGQLDCPRRRKGMGDSVVSHCCSADAVAQCGEAGEVEGHSIETRFMFLSSDMINSSSIWPRKVDIGCPCRPRRRDALIIAILVMALIR